MAYDVHISTEPMAAEMLVVAHKVSAASAAVEKMTQAVCEAETEAATHVCEKVDQGFLNLIMSQVSQKKVLALTTATSQLERLRQLAQLLVRIKDQMGRDYERISARYTKLFRKINDAFRSRIFDVDRPVADVAETSYGIMEHRVMIAAAARPVLEQDTVGGSASLSVARCKADCAKVIDGMKTYVEHGMHLRDAMDAIVCEKKVSYKETIFMPVVIMSSRDIFLQDSVNTDYLIGTEQFQAQTASAVKGKLFEVGEFFNWTNADIVSRDKIVSAVEHRIADEHVDKRVAGIMTDLLAKSKWQVPEAMP